MRGKEEKEEEEEHNDLVGKHYKRKKKDIFFTCKKKGRLIFPVCEPKKRGQNSLLFSLFASFIRNGIYTPHLISILVSTSNKASKQRAVIAYDDMM